MLGRAIARRGKRHSVFLGPRQGGQFGDVLGCKLRVHQHHIGEQGQHPNGAKCLERVIGQLGVERRVDGKRRRIEHHRVAVRRGFRDGIGPDLATCARTVFNHNALPQGLTHFGCDQTRHHIGSAAWRVGHHQGDGFVGVGASLGPRRRRAQTAECECRKPCQRMPLKGVFDRGVQEGSCGPEVGLMGGREV